VNFFFKKKILVIGGTGTIGSEIVRSILKFQPSVVRILSNDENAHFNLQQELQTHGNVRFLIGDIRDKDRILKAVENIDIVFHAAALKHVPLCEYNPFEAIKTNVLGAQNIMETAIDRGVARVVALSTDKAVNPINLYGATKLCSDKLFVSGNSYTGNKDTKFSVVRYGNVMGSRGSVIPYFMKLKEQGLKTFPITHPDMTRFWITLEDAISLVFYALEYAIGEEIFVPKIPSMKIMDLVRTIDEDAKVEIIGIRPGEKLHEVMITEDDRNTYEFDSHYVIEPAFHWWRSNNGHKGMKVPDRFRYSSDSNKEWLKIDDLRRLLCLS